MYNIAEVFILYNTIYYTFNPYTSQEIFWPTENPTIAGLPAVYSVSTKLLFNYNIEYNFYTQTNY